MSITAPASTVRKQEYESEINHLKSTQELEFANRIVKNLQHQNMVTEKIIKDVKQNLKDEEAKKNDSNSYYCPAEPNFYVAILIRSLNGVPPKAKKNLQLLRLSKINQCVIVRNNACMKNMLYGAKDYIAYGQISYELLRKLVYTRGAGKLNFSKVKLTNENIEDAFGGKYRCIEELLDVIFNGKEDIKNVANFLVPMNLNSPLKGFKGRKAKSFIQGGAVNNHGELLGELLERMI